MNEPLPPRIRHRKRGATQTAVLAVLDEERGMARLEVEIATGLTRARTISGLRGLLHRREAFRVRKASAGRTSAYTWFKSPAPDEAAPADE
jgi:hypothetical protein